MAAARSCLLEVNLQTGPFLRTAGSARATRWLGLGPAGVGGQAGRGSSGVTPPDVERGMGRRGVGDRGSAGAALLAVHILEPLALDQPSHPVGQLLAVDLQLVKPRP